MATAFKAALSTIAKATCRSNSSTLISKQGRISAIHLLSSSNGAPPAPSPMVRAHSTLSPMFSSPVSKLASTQISHTPIVPVNKQYSTEVDKEVAKFLEKEIQFESSRTTNELPKIPGFEISTEGGDVTLTKQTGSEKVVVKLSVNGAVDSILAEGDKEKQNEPPQMVCRPPFDVELSKGDKTVVVFQCSFPPPEEPFEDGEQYAKEDNEAERIDDQFEIQEVAIHEGEWKETTFSVSAATMDAELFDLLMDMLDERGITDEFIAQLVDFCTAYENKLYIEFLNKLKAVTEK